MVVNEFRVMRGRNRCSFARGTESSNPSRSSGEARANLKTTSHIPVPPGPTIIIASANKTKSAANRLLTVYQFLRVPDPASQPYGQKDAMRRAGGGFDYHYVDGLRRHRASVAVRLAPATAANKVG